MKLILTADWHFRYDNPRCRTDDFFELEKEIISDIYKIAKKEKAALINGGDVFHKARPEHSQELERFLLLRMLIHNTAFIPGNHGLLYHRIDNLFRSSIGVLDSVNYRYKLEQENENSKTEFHFFGFGEDLQDVEKEKGKYKICVLHKYCEKENLPEYIENGTTAEYLLDNYNYDLFVVGDNHTGFIYEKENRYVVNPGCITRQAADMKDYKPFVVLFDTEKNECEKIYLNDKSMSVINADYISFQRDRENRIESFIKKLKDVVSTDLSFEAMIELYCEKNKVKDEVKEYILKSMEVVG